MFSQREPPDENLQISKTTLNNRRRRRKKKIAQKKKQLGFKKDLQNPRNPHKRVHIGVTMSSWAENFTTAATWQLKHQVAYWKSKAKALEYENKILHDIIKKNYTNDRQVVEIATLPEDEVHHTLPEDDETFEQDFVDEPDVCEENNDYEVSEEFIQFLKDNAKFKEDARLEREKLKSRETDQNLNMTEPSTTTENNEENLKALYGKDWERISALEMSLECNFVESCEKDRPMYWPNIPLNFNFS